MKYSTKLNLSIDGKELNYKVFEALKCVSKTWSQREAAKRLGISHAVLNRRIKESEDKLGVKLVETTGAGSGLTDYAFEILEKYERYKNRLKEGDKPLICGGYISAGLMDALSAEYGFDATIHQTDDESALKLAEMDMVDILTLDDPVRAFMWDLDFTPIAYDHLVLVPSQNLQQPEDLNDLKGAKFVEVQGSSQRLAWNTLDNMGVDYKISKVVRSPHNALKTVQKSEDLYTFLNRSFTYGSEIMRDDTKHIISLVPYSRDTDLNEFIRFILGKGQKLVEYYGFERI
jgi:DNA-binding transcriptional LysR family regulator